MSDISRRAFLASTTALGALPGLARAADPQESDPAAALLLASQEAAKLVQLQVMIGNGVDFEFLRMFDDFHDVNVRVNPSPGGYRGLMPDPAAAAAGRGGRGGFRARTPDVILLFDQIYDMPQENQSSLQRYIEAGKGVIVLHNALTDYQRWPFWYRDVVGGSFLQNRNEELTMKTEKGPAEEMLPGKPATSPDKMIAPGVWDFKEYTVYPVGNHPIIRNVQRFTVRDEKYKNVWQAKNITPVLQTDDSDSDKVVGWVGPHPKAKLFAFMLGHSAEAHAHAMYRKIVHNAVLWAAGRLS